MVVWLSGAVVTDPVVDTGSVVVGGSVVAEEVASVVGAFVVAVVTGSDALFVVVVALVGEDAVLSFLNGKVEDAVAPVVDVCGCVFAVEELEMLVSAELLPEIEAVAGDVETSVSVDERSPTEVEVPATVVLALVAGISTVVDVPAALSEVTDVATVVELSTALLDVVGIAVEGEVLTTPLEVAEAATVVVVVSMLLDVLRAATVLELSTAL